MPHASEPLTQSTTNDEGPSQVNSANTGPSFADRTSKVPPRFIPYPLFEGLPACGGNSTNSMPSLAEAASAKIDLLLPSSPRRMSRPTKRLDANAGLGSGDTAARSSQIKAVLIWSENRQPVESSSNWALDRLIALASAVITGRSSTPLTIDLSCFSDNATAICSWESVAFSRGSGETSSTFNAIAVLCDLELLAGRCAVNRQERIACDC